MANKGFLQKCLRAYVAQDREGLAELALPEDIKNFWRLSWNGQLREAWLASESIQLDTLPAKLRDIIVADRTLLGVKIGLGLPAVLPTFPWASFANLIMNYALFSHYFWVDHKQAYRALLRMTAVSLLYPFSRSTLTGIFLLGHLLNIANFRFVGYPLAHFIFGLTMRQRSLNKPIPRFAENIILAAFPYTNFVSNRIDVVPRLAERIIPFLPPDPYYQTIFQISCLYAYSYSGDVIRSEIYSSTFKKLHQERKLLRYQPISQIIPLLPVVLRGYAHVIAEDFQEIFGSHQAEGHDPAINSQFFRISSIIQLHLGLYDEALKSIELAISYRMMSGFQSWHSFDQKIKKSALLREEPSRQDIIKLQNHQLSGPHVNYFLTRLILEIKNFVSDPEKFKDNLRDILSSHFSWNQISLQKDLPTIFASEPILKVDGHYLIFKGLPEDRSRFIKNILADLSPYIVSLEKSQIQIRIMNDRMAGVATMITVAQTTQMLAHDVRQPFSLTQSLLDQLRQASSYQEMLSYVHEYAPEIERSLLKVNDMIADVMEVGGQGRLQLESTDPESLVTSALLDLFRYAPVHPIQFEYDFQHDHKVTIDSLKVSRVVTNIIKNALEAMKFPGQIWFKTKQHSEFIEFIIGNSGSYILPEQQKQLFEAFYTHGKSRGTGLGLAIAKKIIIAHGGEIWCESDSEKGTEFFFTLKRAPELVEDQPRILPKTPSAIKAYFSSEHRPEPLAQGNEVELEHRLSSRMKRPYRVLIVDDEPIYRKALQKQLLKSNSLAQRLVVLQLPSASDALVQWQTFNPDLVIMDIDFGLHQLDGLSAVRQMRADACAAFICIHSHRDTADCHQEAIQAGADSFAAKPMSRIVLLATLQSLLASEPELPLAEAASKRFALVEDSPLLRYQWSKCANFHLVEAFDCPAAFQSSYQKNPQEMQQLDFLIMDRHFENERETDGLSCIRGLRQSGFEVPIFLSSNSELNPDLASELDIVSIGKHPQQALQQILTHLNSI